MNSKVSLVEKIRQIDKLITCCGNEKVCVMDVKIVLIRVKTILSY